MTEENKELLIKDLCSRLPYGVKVLYDNQVKELQYIEAVYNEVKLLDFTMNYTVDIEEVKPYLFPISSITIDQWNDFGEFTTNDITYVGANVDWFNKNHFDYRGLIEKGLAIDATGLNIY